MKVAARQEFGQELTTGLALPALSKHRAVGRAAAFRDQAKAFKVFGRSLYCCNAWVAVAFNALWPKP